MYTSINLVSHSYSTGFTLIILADDFGMATNKKDKEHSFSVYVLAANMSPFHLYLSSSGNTVYNNTLPLFL